jgi:hypothetical protein
MGPAVVEPTLRFLDSGLPEFGRYAACEVLSKVGTRDDRIFQRLCEVFDENAFLGCMNFASYGDPRALPLLEEALFDWLLDPDDPFGDLRELRELAHAYEDIAGALTPELEEHVTELCDVIRALNEERADVDRPRIVVKIGRNEPCPCGSGKKYKKCCAA